jgi:hypothetical protein
MQNCSVNFGVFMQYHDLHLLGNYEANVTRIEFKQELPNLRKSP